MFEVLIVSTRVHRPAIASHLLYVIHAFYYYYYVFRPVVISLQTKKHIFVFFELVLAL